jgi:hypothetical protein
MPRWLKPGPGFDPVLLIGAALVVCAIVIAIFGDDHTFNNLGWAGIGVMLARVI